MQRARNRAEIILSEDEDFDDDRHHGSPRTMPTGCFDADFDEPRAAEANGGSGLIQSSGWQAPCIRPASPSEKTGHEFHSPRGRECSEGRKNGTPPSAPPATATATASAEPPRTASAPITSHFDAVLECISVLRSMRDDEAVCKQDVIECIEPMLNSMLSSVLMHSFCTSMSVRGWKVE
jgi:hypothetical protein